MDNDLRSTLQLIFDILQSTLIYTFIWGSKAFDIATRVLHSSMNDDGWLTRLALTLLIILAGLQALKMAYRGVMFWIRFAFRFALIVGSIGIMMWIWSRGFDGAGEDLGILSEFWTEQYHRYESQSKTGKAMYDVLQDARDAIINERQRAEQVHGGARYW